MRYLCFIVAIVVMMSANLCFADLKDLYATYGELQIQAEIIQGRTNQVKAQIAQELQKPKEPPKAEVVDGK